MNDLECRKADHICRKPNEAGYGEDEIKKMQTENAEKAQAVVDRFNAGETGEDAEETK